MIREYAVRLTPVIRSTPCLPRPVQADRVTIAGRPDLMHLSLAVHPDPSRYEDRGQCAAVGPRPPRGQRLLRDGSRDHRQCITIAGHPLAAGGQHRYPQPPDAQLDFLITKSAEPYRAPPSLRIA